MKTEYQLFICDVSGEHAPICVFISDSPFPCFMVGDRFDGCLLIGVGNV